MKKERYGAFSVQDKEPVIERITQLARRYSSRSAAARAWGINVNTINSYYKRDVVPPMPRENVLARIAECEGVSLDWLKAGEDKDPPKTPNEIDFRDELYQMLSFLTPEERHQLTITLARKGVETVLYLLDDTNIRLLQSDERDKVRALAMIESKKGTPETDQDVAAPRPSGNNMKAG